MSDRDDAIRELAKGIHQNECGCDGYEAEWFEEGECHHYSGYVDIAGEYVEIYETALRGHCDGSHLGWPDPMVAGCTSCEAKRRESFPQDDWMAKLSWPMIVCRNCGNKRCPKATDHRSDCTGSNEPGQTGSRYA